MVHRIWYTVYSADDDTLLAYGGPEECAKMFGVSRQYMQSIISSTKSGRLKCYTIVREDLDAKTYRVYGEWHRGRPRRKKKVVAKIVKQ